MTARNLALEALKEMLEYAGIIEERCDAVATDKARKAISALEAETGEPVDCQFQGTDGRWHSFLNDQHKDNTIASGKWPIRNLYAAPPPAVPPGWKLVPIEPTEAMLAEVPEAPK